MSSTWPVSRVLPWPSGGMAHPGHPCWPPSLPSPLSNHSLGIPLHPSFMNQGKPNLAALAKLSCQLVMDKLPNQCNTYSCSSSSLLLLSQLVQHLSQDSLNGPPPIFQESGEPNHAKLAKLSCQAASSFLPEVIHPGEFGVNNCAIALLCSGNLYN